MDELRDIWFSHNSQCEDCCLWNMRRCCLMEVDMRFGRYYYLHHQGRETHCWWCSWRLQEPLKCQNTSTEYMILLLEKSNLQRQINLSDIHTMKCLLLQICNMFIFKYIS